MLRVQGGVGRKGGGVVRKLSLPLGAHHGLEKFRNLYIRPSISWEPLCQTINLQSGTEDSCLSASRLCRILICVIFFLKYQVGRGSGKEVGKGWLAWGGGVKDHEKLPLASIQGIRELKKDWAKPYFTLRTVLIKKKKKSVFSLFNQLTQAENYRIFLPRWWSQLRSRFCGPRTKTKNT